MSISGWYNQAWLEFIPIGKAYEQLWVTLRFGTVDKKRVRTVQVAKQVRSWCLHPEEDNEKLIGNHSEIWLRKHQTGISTTK